MSRLNDSGRIRAFLLLLIACSPLAWAGEDLALPRGQISAGGGLSEGGEFRVQGSAGQFDADALQPASGGGFALTGGFWAGLSSVAAPPSDEVFRDGFEQP